MIASAALVVVAAITVVTFPGGNKDHPRLSGTSGPSRPAATGQPGAGASRFPATQPPAITRVQARRILAAYWRVKNQADELRSDSLAGTIEAGASFRMDIGAYRFGRVADPANHGHVAVSPVHTTFYIPRLPAGDYPRWFVAAVGYTSPARSGYLLFSQGTPGGSLEGPARAGPADGHRADAGYCDRRRGIRHCGQPGRERRRGLSVAPGRIEARTAAFLNEGGTAATRPPGT